MEFPIGYVLISFLIAVIIGGAVYMLLIVPRIKWASAEGFADTSALPKKRSASEGFSAMDASGSQPAGGKSDKPPAQKATEAFFGGVARGAGHPDCLRTLDGAAKVLGAFAGRKSMFEEGQPDLEELSLILSKLACLKKDLLSPSGIVDATRYQPFETMHDREPVAEVTATCLNHTIAGRDLDIIFATWRDRGNLLIRRLCTETGMSEADVKRVEADFKGAWQDVYDVAKSKCLLTVDEGKGVALVGGRVPENLLNAREYDGYFSGWSGQI